MALDRMKMPDSAWRLIPLAERWGIDDDFEREAAVDSASYDQLRHLAASLDDVEDEFWDWLAGPESYSPSPSTEYLAMTALTMAVDSARVTLERRSEV